MIRILFSTVLFFYTVSPLWAAIENLDEVVTRKDRIATATWSPSFLENPTTYIWQPETLQYFDTTTGREVWRLTHAPGYIGGSNQDIATTHWSANGDRLMLRSTRLTQAYTFTTPKWFAVNTDGTLLRPAVGSAARMAGYDSYINWSPVIPDVIYQGNANDGQSTSNNVLYKTTVYDESITTSPFLTFTTAITRMNLKKALSGDGSRIMVKDFNGAGWFPAKIYPEADKAILDADGYSSTLNFDYYWGATPSPWSGYHDNYLAGAVNGIDGVWNILMPEYAEGSFWRARMAGTAADGAPSHTIDHTPPYNWGGEIEPVNTRTTSLAANDPWCPQGVVSGTDCQQYPGHLSPDRWGHYNVMVWGNYAPYGAGVYDARNHTTEIVSGLHTGGDHTDWEAWSDWVLLDGADSYQPWNGVNGVKRTYTFNYKTGSGYDVSYTHSNYNQGSTTTQSYTGPIQSPDGTKVQWVSSFLVTSDLNHQAFWSVAYYPYPPEIRSATKVSSSVRLTWDFNQGSSCKSQSTSSDRSGPTPNFTTPRTYATRGWPHETSDCPPSPREVDKFRIWSSTDNSTWSPVATVNYNNCRAGNSNECGMWGESAWSYDATQPVSSTRYYAITSVEYSGLESRSLGNVWKVVTDGSGNISTQTQQTAYPASPGGVSSFFTTYHSALTRHYNIYAADGSAPSVSQTTRIASVPVSAGTNYIDWLGNPTGNTQYKVTAVDSQGNESDPLTITSATHKTAPATADGQYTLSWTNNAEPPATSASGKIRPGNGKVKTGTGKLTP